MSSTSTSTSGSSSSSSSSEEVKPSPAIPEALFLENVEEYMKGADSVDAVLARMQENYSKYKYIEMQLLQRKRTLQRKLPEIQKTAEMVRYLIEKRDANESINTHYELSECVFANAVIKKPTHVCLFLGANVMVEYAVEEALELLEKNITSATASLRQTEVDTRFLKEQITTTEVNIARVYNYDVKQRRLARAATGGATQ